MSTTYAAANILSSSSNGPQLLLDAGYYDGCGPAKLGLDKVIGVALDTAIKFGEEMYLSYLEMLENTRDLSPGRFVEAYLSLAEHGRYIPQWNSHISSRVLRDTNVLRDRALRELRSVTLFD